VVFRMLQAIGGSMLNPVAMSIITNTFTDPKERARAIGAWGAVVGISLGFGPIVGGALTESIGWRAIFWMNVPIGVVAFAMTALYVPESRAGHARKIDPLGQVLVIVVLASLVFGIIEGPRSGWLSLKIVGCFVLAVGATVALIMVERRRREPLIQLHFFRSVPFSGATIVAVCVFSAFSGFLFLNTLYLQEVRNYSPFQAGLHTLPLALITLFAAPLSGRLVARLGARIPLLISGASIVISAAMLLQLRPNTPELVLFVIYAIFGLGFGAVNPPITNTAVSGMPRAQAGVAAAIASTSRQVGQSLGVAVMGSVVTSRVHSSLHDQLTSASHVGWWVVLCLGLVVFALGFVTTGQWARTTAERTAATFDA
jgi:EmrB/QacA subfamily drug resistance transporter